MSELPDFLVKEHDADGVEVDQFRRSALRFLYKYWLSLPSYTLGQAIQELTVDRSDWINWDDMEWCQYIQEDLDERERLEQEALKFYPEALKIYPK